MHPKKKRTKLTTGGKITLTAFSLMGFIGGWNLIAHLDKPTAQADELPPRPASSPVLPAPTPWPTVPPLVDRQPVPTLLPTRTILGADQPPVSFKPEVQPVQIAPLPTLAPLPALAPLPELPAAPPPPPPPPVPNQQWSGGS